MTEGKTFRSFLSKTRGLQTIIVNCIDFSVIFDENVGKYKEIDLSVLQKKSAAAMYRGTLFYFSPIR